MRIDVVTIGDREGNCIDLWQYKELHTDSMFRITGDADDGRPSLTVTSTS